SVADRMAKDCLILPDAGVDLTAIDEWADTATTSHRDGLPMMYFQCTKGLAEYRHGRYASATNWMQPYRDSSDPFLNIYANIVRARARCRQAERELTRGELRNAVKIAETKSPPLNTDNLFKNVHWADWILAHALTGEARALISSAAVPEPGQPP